MNKKYAGLISILLLSNVFFAVQLETKSGKSQVNVIKIGLLAPLAQISGKDMEKGAILAVKEINAAGGVLLNGTNFNFELIVEDSSSPLTGVPDPSIAVTNARKLMNQDDVAVMLGGSRNEVAIAVMEQLDRPFLGVGTTAPIISHYFWRVGPANGSIITRGIIDLFAYGLSQIEPVITNVTIIRENVVGFFAMSKSIKNLLHSVLPLTYGFRQFNFTEDVVLEETETLDSVLTALTPLKTEYQGLKINAIITLLRGQVGKYVSQTWAQLDMSQMLCGINIKSQENTFFEETEGAAYGEIQLESYLPDMEASPKTQPFRDAYYGDYREMPAYTSFTSYDSIYLIKDAIIRAGSITPTALQTVLATTDYQGAAYKIKFTNEPGSQSGTNATGDPEPIPGAPDNITVHDLWTPQTVGILGFPYYQTCFVQWQQGGGKKTIWTRLGESIDTRDITQHIIWPIDHSQHGYEPITTAEPPTSTEPVTTTEPPTSSEPITSTEPSTSSEPTTSLGPPTTTEPTTSESSTDKSTSELAPPTIIPGFTLPILICILIGVVIIREHYKKTST
ncbi:MAG: ABC transporter substrate-binding protein [Promethearchaeota archaeon]